MARRKKRNKRKSHHGFFGIGEKPSGKTTYLKTAKEGLFVLLSAIAAGGAGAALGKHSFLAGIPVAVLGVHHNNKYVLAAGLGLVLSNGFQKQGTTASDTTTESVEGFDLKQMATDAKDRVGTFFKNFGEKLYLPQSQGSSTSGLGNDDVTYFVNPYSKKELDMSAIDRIQEQIAQMNQGTAGLQDIEREF